MYSGTSKIYQAACRNLRETMSKNGNRSNKSRLSYTKKHVALRPAGADEVCFCISWFSLHFCKLWSETPGHVICLCQWLLRHRPSPWPQWRGVSALNSDEVCVKSLTKIKIPCMWFRFMQKIQLAILWLFNYCVGVLRPGILAAIKGVLRLRPGSLCWLGIPCSLLIWVSLGTSKRGTLFDMFGDISLESVRKSNIHLGRAALLILLCVARQIWWAVEQPGSSRLPKMPFFAELLMDKLIPTSFQRLSCPQLCMLVLFM